MDRRTSHGWQAPIPLVISLLIASASGAATVKDLAGHDDIFGRYAPGGDCKRQPQIVADKSGLAFEMAGKTEKTTQLEYVTGYNGPDYQGIEKVIFPFTRPDGEYPIIMQFNFGQKPSALSISGHAEGFPGGPPLNARNKALVDASLYARAQVDQAGFSLCPRSSIWSNAPAAGRATKAFVVSFSGAIGSELKGTGVNVICVAPGYTKTEFAEVAESSDKRARAVLGEMSAEDVVALALRKAEHARYAMPGWRNRLMVASSRFSPRFMSTAIARWLLEPRP